MPFDDLKPYLGDLDALLHVAQGEKAPYAQPALKNLGAVTLVVLRRVIAPASFRNAEAEVTDIDHDGVRRVRAVANKFKFGERSRGLQVLRHFGAGGASAQNKTAFRSKEKPSERFDLNTFVFGDSANHGNKVLPVKAAALYSDAISVQPYGDAVDATFHNRASEDGTLWNAEKKENSNNIFDRHFVRPGTLLLQTIALNGRTAPPEALEHLLLAMGLAGAYGGGTSIYGINVENRAIGLFASRFERATASPYVALAQAGAVDGDDPGAVADAVWKIMEVDHAVAIPGAAVAAEQARLVGLVEADDAALRARYGDTARKVGAYFDAWFEGIGA